MSHHCWDFIFKIKARGNILLIFWRIGMLSEACKTIRQAVYGIIGSTQLGKRINVSNGTAFLISPNILVSAAHVAHLEGNVAKPNHLVFEVIRSPEVGQPMGFVQLIADDPIRDIALFRIDNPNGNPNANLKNDVVPPGTQCGSLGFPLAEVTFSPQGRMFNLVERFQGSFISSYHSHIPQIGRSVMVYETDSLMYKGSSGCPIFLPTGEVVGMQVASQMEKNNTPKTKKLPDTRLAISLVIPSLEIISFVKEQGIAN